MTLDQVLEVIGMYEKERPPDDLIRGFSLSEQLGGNNPKWRVWAGDGSSYVLKWSKNNLGRVPEINEREALTSLLGRLLGVPAIDAWVIPSGLVPHDPLPEWDEREAPLIRDRCVLMPFLGCPTVAGRQPAAAIRVAWNPSAVADLFAFMHWIGDEDRGLDDVMLDGDRLVLIDNGLCGPGRPESTLRGYHPYWEGFGTEARLGKCYGGKSSLVGFVLRHLGLPHGLFVTPPVVGRIMNLTDASVRAVVGHVGIHPRAADVLIERKRTLAADYLDWFRQVSDLFGGGGRGEVG